MTDIPERNSITNLYGSSLALLTDLYELTMTYGYWKQGMADTEAMFTLFFREQPFGGGYSVACGLGQVIEFITSFGFDESDIGYLSGLTTADGAPLFDAPFLAYLGEIRLSVDIDAVPEGTVVFPSEPMLRINGPIIQCQILETALLNMLNSQTLIATKAARICQAAGNDPVLEFGLRRAQGIDGGIMASRAAYIGGCAGTSNVLAGKLFDIPVRGTHAHSWVMAFDTEPEAFSAWADAMPHNAIFLVDTYDTIEGVQHAIEAGKILKAHGHNIAGIRLDSGDLASLSREARRLLDDAGFTETFIVGSSDLDEHAIAHLKGEGAPIAVWGVGTKLVTAWDSPALTGVYKLSAIRSSGGSWEYRMKVSDEQFKSTIPGKLQVRRFEREGAFAADVIYDEDIGIGPDTDMVSLRDGVHRKADPAKGQSEDILKPVFRDGSLVYERPALFESRERTQSQLGALDDEVKRLDSPATYETGIEAQLYELRERLIVEKKEHR